MVVALPPQDTTQPTAAEFHAKFRSLLSLTELISAINNGGHPKLAWSDERDYTKHDTLDNVLDAIAHILVRYEEVIAVAASSSGVVAVQHQEVTEDTEEPDSKASKDAEDAEGTEGTDDKENTENLHDAANDPDSGPVHIRRIATIVNPQVEDAKLYHFPTASQVILIHGGKSYLPIEFLDVDSLCEHFLNTIKSGSDPALKASYLCRI